MKNGILFLFIIAAFGTIAQTRQYAIHEAETDMPVAFAKITSSDTALISDLDGKFSLPEEVKTIRARMIGYRDTTYRLKDGQNVYYILPEAQVESEVTVVAGENPAHRIMNLVIENRKKNHPQENDAFRYESYSRFVFDADPEMIKASDTTNVQMMQIREFLTNQHLFLNETSAIRNFSPPARDHEEIVAYKTSGFNSPLFATFTREIQSFNFYDNQFELMGQTYINPIAAGGTRRYLFQLQDTLVLGMDTTFTITFRPRMGKNFDGIEGILYINTNGYAVEKVIASPFEKSELFEVKIIQEYEFTNNYKWFPVKLSTELSVAIQNDSIPANIDGRGVIYISKIEFNPEGKKKIFFDNTEVSTAEGAGDLKEEEWAELRGYELSEKDRKTYQVLDSLGEATKLDRKLNSLLLLAQGKIPLGKFNIELMRIINYNAYEGYRFGLGLETSERLSKHFTSGAYFGWATRDKEFKYGGFTDLHLYKKRDLTLSLIYQDDISERGGYQFRRDDFNLNSPSVRRRFYVEKMDRQRLAQVGLSGLILANLKVHVFGNYQRISVTDEYQYFSESQGRLFSEFDLAESGVEIVWNIRERVMRLGNYRISKGTQYPKLALQVKKGQSSWFDADFDYWKYVLEISEDINIRGAGTFSWLAQGSVTEGEVPLFLLNTPFASGGNWNLSVQNTFETMVASTFFGSRQINLFTRFNFMEFKTKSKWHEPQFFVHHALGYSELSDRDQHLQTEPLRSMDKGYYEAGGGVNSLLVMGATGLGIGVFYQYGYYESPYAKENLTYKISLKVNFP